MISDPFDPSDANLNYPLRLESAQFKTLPQRIEGLPTSGLMGTIPTLTVGGLIAFVALLVNLAVQYFGITIPPDLQQFADQYGVMVATIVVPLITAALTYFKVFSPQSAAQLKAGLR